MNMEEKSDFQRHYDKMHMVFQQLRRKFAIPWQELIHQAPNEDYTKLQTWFPEHCALLAIERAKEREFAEKAGKILFNLFSEDDTETDLLVIQARKQLKEKLKVA